MVISDLLDRRCLNAYLSWPLLPRLRPAAFLGVQRHEARMQQKPADSFQELNVWLWSETALSNLLRAVRDRMRADGDPTVEAIAFGVAR
ncbi:MAG: hypothetical protein JOZ87_33305 [Chloroflexi bacterium]|nr:hypothetical protein [Chloroflexota bacterium]